MYPDRMWSTGEGNGKPLQYSCLKNPMNSMKRQNDRILKELPRLVGAQYTTGDQWRNNSRKNEETEPKQKQSPAVDVTGDGSKVWCCKEQYCIGTWNVRSMNPGKLGVDFHGGSGFKASACNAGDLGSIPGLGRSPGEGDGKPIQYSCLENPMNRMKK